MYCAKYRVCHKAEEEIFEQSDSSMFQRQYALTCRLSDLSNLMFYTHFHQTITVQEKSLTAYCQQVVHAAKLNFLALKCTFFKNAVFTKHLKSHFVTLNTVFICMEGLEKAPVHKASVVLPKILMFSHDQWSSHHTFLTVVGKTYLGGWDT